jgi:hypothetical protein
MEKLIVTGRPQEKCLHGRSKCRWLSRGKSPIMGRFPNMSRYIISPQEVLRSLLKNVNHRTDETVLSNHCINYIN